MCTELVEEMDERYLGNLWLNDLFIDKDSLLDVVDDIRTKRLNVILILVEVISRVLTITLFLAVLFTWVMTLIKQRNNDC